MESQALLQTAGPQLKSRNHRVSLNWTQLDAVITGISAIDLQSLAIRNRQEAINFVREYGFDINEPTACREIARAHREAITFIESLFLTEEQRHLLDPSIRNPEHVVDLLVYSSNYLNKSNARQLWACAVLKVMHGIFHIDHDSKLMYFDDIRKQIFESIDKVIITKDEVHYLSDEQLMIPLYHLEKKRNKDRQSVLLKLLQKPSYVASDIYDHLGIRLVFETKAECLFALKALRRSHLITVTNIKPFRTRNSLINIKECKKVFNRYRHLLNRADGYPIEILRKIDRELDSVFEQKDRDYNPHSSVHFQSIQVTARKMVRVENPLYTRMQQLISYIGDKMPVPEELHLNDSIGKEHSFYFDFEIQLLDRRSYVNTITGPASHEAYKSRQRSTARKRVLGPELIEHIENQNPSPEGAWHA